MAEGSGGGSAAMKGCLLLGFLGAMCGVMGVAASMLLVGRDASTSPTGAGPASVDGGGAPQPGAAVPAVDPAPTGNGMPARIKARGVLRVGMDTGEPPFTGTPPMYLPNKNGEPDGFDVVLARRIAKRIGAGDIKVVHEAYSDLEALVRQPEQVDLVISGYAATDDPGLAFSQPYLDYGLCLVVPTKSKVATTSDLFGKKIAVFDDDAAVEEVKKLVKGYTDLARLENGYWDQLADGRFDGFLYDYPYTVAELNQWYKANPSRQGSLRIAQYNLTDSHYVVMLRAGDDELLKVVNDTIAEWKASEDYAAAVKAWLKGGLSVEPPKSAKVHVVEKGETLSVIAKAELGSVDDWPRLWELNKDRFPNPHLIDVGDRVVLP